uniref:Uncharacterized protein n=1 Tax=Picea glauca TaxID=3330 RepID=A0A101M4S6_PICGL|nr:hypothetical protein ABT39_MTgene708 [Picea glauca]
MDHEHLNKLLVLLALDQLLNQLCHRVHNLLLNLDLELELLVRHHLNL